jgi:cytochrome c oxidase subunit I
VTASAIGGFILLASGILLVINLAAAHRRRGAGVAPFTFSRTAHPRGHTPVALNGFGLWLALMIGLSVVNYGYPIVQLASLKEASVPVIPIGSR